jgi:hypothetical protein
MPGDVEFMNNQRTEELSDIRAIVDALQTLCATVRASWPERYPLPADLDALLVFQEFTLERVRSGQLRRMVQEREMAVEDGSL